MLKITVLMAIQRCDRDLPAFGPGQPGATAAMEPSLPPPTLPPRHIVSFDAIRLLAALHIVNGHLFEGTFIAHHFPVALTVLLASSASYSSSLFFVLSGFVLAYARRRRMMLGVPAEQSWHCLARHVGRVAPYLLGGAGLQVAIKLIAEGGDASDFPRLISSVSLVYPFFGRLPFFNASAWALSTFVLGYIIDAFGGNWLAMLSRRCRLWTLVALLIFLHGAAFAIGQIIGDAPSYPPRNFPVHSVFFHIFAPSRVLEILVGMLLGSMVCDGHAGIRGALGRLPGVGLGWLPVAGVLLNGTLLTLLAQVSGKTAYLMTHGLLLVPTGLMLVSWAVFDDGRNRTGWAALLAHGGKLSLPVFLLHIPCNAGFRALLKFASVSWPQESWSFFLGYFLTLLFTATAAARLFGLASHAVARLRRRSGERITETQPSGS